MTKENESFVGIKRLYGKTALERFHSSRILIIGLGGVGSWVVEALARSGVGTLGLVDLDEICVTNINRQLHALPSTVGKSKGHLLEQRAKAINPNINIEKIEAFYTEGSSESILSTSWDYVVDAIDSVSQKAHLIMSCKTKGIPIVTVGGAGGRIDPFSIKTADLAQTQGDRLLMLVRKCLRQKHRFPRNLKTKFKIPAVYSDEFSRFPWSDGSVCQVKEEGSASGINCDTGLGSATHLTGNFGFATASIVLKHLAESSH